ncbi:unnamed protein product [Ectocarpus sp. 12 AP-2014]
MILHHGPCSLRQSHPRSRKTQPSPTPSFVLPQGIPPFNPLAPSPAGNQAPLAAS